MAKQKKLPNEVGMRRAMHSKRRVVEKNYSSRRSCWILYLDCNHTVERTGASSPEKVRCELCPVSR